MGFVDYVAAGLAVIGGLVVFLKAVQVAIPGDKDDKFIGPVIGFCEKILGWLGKPKS